LVPRCLRSGHKTTQSNTSTAFLPLTHARSFVIKCRQILRRWYAHQLSGGTYRNNYMYQHSQHIRLNAKITFNVTNETMWRRMQKHAPWSTLLILFTKTTTRITPHVFIFYGYILCRCQKHNTGFSHRVLETNIPINYITTITRRITRSVWAPIAKMPNRRDLCSSLNLSTWR